MTDLLVFPPGVRSGHPFSRAGDARDWLVNAAGGAYGPMTDVLLGLDQMLGLDWHRPLYPGALPYPVPAPSARLERAIAGGALQRRSAAPDGRPPQFEVIPVAGYLPAQGALMAWLIAQGAEILARGTFDAAEKPDRPAAAAVLGAYEGLLIDWDVAATASVNRWVTAGWADALNGTVPVVPDPTPGTSPYTPRPTFVLHTPT